MFKYYKGFVIEKDKTLDSDICYFKRINGDKFISEDGIERSVDSAEYKDVLRIIDNIIAKTK